MGQNITVTGFFNNDIDQECYVKVLNEKYISINDNIPKKDFPFIYYGFHPIEK